MKSDERTPADAFSEEGLEPSVFIDPPKDLRPLMRLGVVVYALWFVWATWGRPATEHLGPQVHGVLGLAARVVTWVVPCFVYLRRVWGPRFVLPLGLGFPLGARQVRRTCLLTLVMTWGFFAATAARNHVGILAEVGRFAQFAEPRLTAPLLEELVFRGVFLSELLTWTHRNSRSPWGLRGRYWAAQLGCALFFVVVHWPSWWPGLHLSATLQRSIPIFAVGMVLGFVFAHTRSIWPCIWLHWLNNELSLMA